MILDSTTKVARIVLGEGKTTNDCDVVTSYADFSLDASIFQWGNQNTHSNGTTPVVIVAAPTVGFQRQIKEVRLFNNDTVSHTVSLQLYDGTTVWIVGPSKQLIPPNGSFIYTPDTPADANSSLWNAGYVTALDASLSIISGSIGVETLAASALFGNPTGSAARPAAIGVGAGLAIAANTLVAQWNGGTVSALATSITISSGTIAAVSVGSGASLYNNLTVSRGLGPTYTNTQGKPIFVSAAFHSSAAATFQVIVDGVVIQSIDQVTAAAVTALNFIVPIGKTYGIALSTGTGFVDQWFELY